jgi:endonuclease/exonuclease/phosphatase family metal-dependent hydrolase
MTLNVLRGGTQLGQPLAQCARVIQAARADVVGLQEIGENAEDLADLLGWQLVREGSRAIITRFEVIERYPGGVKMKSDSGHEFCLFNIHFRASPYQPYQLLKIPYGNAPFITTEEEAVAMARKARGDQVEALLGEIAKGPGDQVPVFVTGDFNEPSHLDWTAEAAAIGRHPIKVSFPSSLAMEQAGFRDAWRVVHPDIIAEPGNTWTPVTEITDPKDHHDRIDFVYSRGAGLEVRSAQVVGEKMEMADLVVEPYPSDHRGVVVHFAFTDPAGDAK